MPTQNKSESVQDYILRVCTAIESLRVPLSDQPSFKESKSQREARVERVNGEDISY